MSDSWRTIENPAIGDVVTFVETCEESGGERTLLDIRLAPGGGNPSHVHASYSERFEVLEGTLGVQVGREVRTLAAGEDALVEPGTPHRFFNPSSEPTRFLVELRPGHAGFEQAVRILYGLARDGKANAAGMPKNPYHIAVAGSLSDMSPTGVLGLLGPLWRLLARRARTRGLEQELIATYCTPPAVPSR